MIRAHFRKSESRSGEDWSCESVEQLIARLARFDVELACLRFPDDGSFHEFDSWLAKQLEHAMSGRSVIVNGASKAWGLFPMQGEIQGAIDRGGMLRGALHTVTNQWPTADGWVIRIAPMELNARAAAGRVDGRRG